MFCDNFQSAPFTVCWNCVFTKDFSFKNCSKLQVISKRTRVLHGLKKLVVRCKGNVMGALMLAAIPVTVDQAEASDLCWTVPMFIVRKKISGFVVCAFILYQTWTIKRNVYER